MYGDSTAIEGIFGSRLPLRPRIASLDEEPTNSHEAKVDQLGTRDGKGTDVEYLRSSGAATSVQRPSASTSTGIRKSTVIAPRQVPITKPDAKLSAVSTLDPKVLVKWSDVAALGSEAFRLKDHGATVSFNILPAIMKNADVFDALMLNCPDFPTVYALVASCTTAKHTFERHSQGIIKAILNRMPQELRYLTVALIGINGSKILDSESIKTLMETWLGPGSKPLTERLQKNPLEIIRKLARSFSAIDLFTQVIPKNCVNNFTDYKAVVASRQGIDYDDVVSDWHNKHPLCQQTEWSDVPDDTEWEFPGLPTGPQVIALPMTEGELYRTKRALLRYEVFCALFYLGPDRYFDTRHHPHRYNQEPDLSRGYAFREDQIVFFNEYVSPWEVGELAVITHVMHDLVRNAYFTKYMSLRDIDANKPGYQRTNNGWLGRDQHRNHDGMVDEFDNHTVWFASQGLTLLRKIYDDRKMGYEALVKKHCEPRYRLAECFVPFEMCAKRRGFYTRSSPNASWKPRKVWSDTPGMELPSTGWLSKSPVIDFNEENDSYGGDKWMRKIGYYIWDRD